MEKIARDFCRCRGKEDKLFLGDSCSFFFSSGFEKNDKEKKYGNSEVSVMTPHLLRKPCLSEGEGLVITGNSQQNLDLTIILRHNTLKQLNLINSSSLVP